MQRREHVNYGKMGNGIQLAGRKVATTCHARMRLSPSSDRDIQHMHRGAMSVHHGDIRRGKQTTLCQRCRERGRGTRIKRAGKCLRHTRV